MMRASGLGARVSGGSRAASGRLPGALVAVGWLLVAGVAAEVRAEIIERIMAVVDGRVIMLSDVRGFADLGLVQEEARTAEAVLTRLIERELMLTEVDRYVLAEPPLELLGRRLERIRARFPAPDAYQAALGASGLDEARVRAIVRDTLRIERYLDERFASAAEPTDEEVARYYRERVAEFTRDGRVPPFDEVRAAARERLGAERRRALIGDWVSGLMRRAEVLRLDALGRPEAIPR